ncbi:DUF4908 domain-containing protein [Phenylobacterium sp.]|uniref:DUF4908 domain-containing protein n=1 Tax=Phenylobacterium sp. TaxID=1871053 RepID=UPI002732860B|nr:DUF4908 domain-containing protein [Phenylobacterium sp.]MDP3659334.1 DUF4908 domain-containing protein [Phenylobacterium sp.]
MASDTPAILRAFLLATLVAAGGTGFVGQALAAPETLREGLFGGRTPDGRNSTTAPAVARYVSEDGQSFILDRTQGRPLLKFENSPEVWALLPQPAPRGDVIYKNDLGEPVLRATRLGGVTVFTDTRPGGSAAALAGGATPLKLAPLGPQALLERLAQATLRASRAARRLITFEAEATPASSALIADAATVAAEAVVRMARRGDGKKMLAQFNKVTLVAGRKPSTVIQQGVMRITVAPGEGLAGRPSSDRILATLER